MAASMVSPNNIPECSICCENFKSPKFLPCGHTFCLDCLERFIGDRIEIFPCPLCAQDITLPAEGAKMFATNFIATSTTPDIRQSSTTLNTASADEDGTESDTVQQGGTTLNTTQSAQQSSKFYCTNHSVREVEYYCIQCNILVCNRCFITQHNGHEFTDTESETAKEDATALVSTSKKFIENKIENLEKAYAALLETSENLKCFGEDACRRISEQTERIIEDLKEKSEEVQNQIRHNVDQTETELTETREKVMEQIKNFKLDLETNLPCLTKDSCVQILVSLPKIKQLEQLCEKLNNNTLKAYQYMYKDWSEQKFSVDIDMFGFIVTKSYYLHKFPNHFRFNINDIKEEDNNYYSDNKFTSNDVVWSCYIRKFKNGYLGIYNGVLSSDNPKLDSCFIDWKVSLLNIDDDSKTITKTSHNNKLGFTCKYSYWGWSQFISWATFIDKNNGYISSDGQFVVQFDITQVRETSFK